MTHHVVTISCGKVSISGEILELRMLSECILNNVLSKIDYNSSQHNKLSV